VPGVIVQNGRAQSCLTHRAVTTDRAEIGQIYGIAFTGESKLVRKATGYEKKPTPHRHRVRRLREPTFPAPFDCISDPQIPPTRPSDKG
jgi:hypothetical protein